MHGIKRCETGNLAHFKRTLFAILLFSAIANAQFKCPDSLLYTFNPTPTQSFIVSWNPFTDYYAPGTFTNTSVSATGLVSNIYGISLSPALHGGTVSPTFYTTQFGQLYRWNGASWVTTNVLISNSQIVDIAGCAGAMFALVDLGGGTFEVKKHTPPSAVVSLFTVTSVASQIVTDCSCNFYLLSKSGLQKFDASGALIKTYAFSGNPFLVTGGKFGIVGNTIYYISPGLPGNFPTLFKGKATIKGDSIFTSTLSSLSSNVGSLWFANCPVMSVTDPGATISAGAIGCVPGTASIAVSSTHTTLQHHWSGPGLVAPAGTGSSVTVSQPGNYTVEITEGYCDQLLQTLTVNVGSNVTVVSPTILSGDGFCHKPGMQLFSSITGPGFSRIWQGPQITGSANGTSITPGVPGIYSLTVTDNGNGCSGTATAHIQEPLNLNVILNSPTMCVYAATSPSSIVLTLNGSPTFTILTPPGFSANVAPGQPVAIYHVPPFITTGSPGTATLLGSNGACTASIIASFSVLPVSGISAIPADAKICSGATLQLTAVGAQHWKWQPGEYVIGSSGNKVTVKVDKTTTFTVTGIDQFGCGTPPRTVAVEIYPGISGRLEHHGAVCAPACKTFVFHSNTTSGYSASWSVAGKSVAGSNHFDACFTKPGKVAVHGMLTDSIGCRSFYSDTITVFEKPHAEFSWFPEEPGEALDVVRFAGAASAEQIPEHSWFVHDGNSTAKYEGNSFSKVFPATGNYPVAYLVMNEWGCSDTLVKIIHIKEDFLFYIPNTFTPNGDGKNDVFGAVHRGLHSISFSIYNRWGEEVFTTSNPYEGWSGEYEGLSCPQGVYAWKAKLVTNRGDVKEMCGTVMLMR